jgi:hypothetical protein
MHACIAIPPGVFRQLAGPYNETRGAPVNKAFGQGHPPELGKRVPCRRIGSSQVTIATSRVESNCLSTAHPTSLILLATRLETTISIDKVVSSLLTTRTNEFPFPVL